MKYLSAVSSYMHDGERWMKLENWCKNYYMRGVFHKLYTVFAGLQPEGGLYKTVRELETLMNIISSIKSNTIRYCICGVCGY